MNNPVYGLVLSGGGVRCIAQIGAIKALEEQGIYPSVIAGASAGAIVGAFYAAGYTWEEILSFFQHTTLFSVNNYTYRKPGLIDTDKFYHILVQYFPEDGFEALKKPLYISATDIVAGKNKIFHKGPLIYPVLASAAFPVVLSPVEINGALYADGGITNNFPVEPLLGRCDKIIGSYVNPLKKINPKALTTSYAVLDRALKIGMASVSEQKFAHCDLIIAPQPLNDFGTFSMNRMDEIFHIGYETTRKLLESLEVKEVH